MGMIRRMVLFALILVPAWFRVYKSGPLGMPARNEGQIERGAYLVKEVAKCSERHTLRSARGELDQDAMLTGAPIWVTPGERVSIASVQDALTKRNRAGDET